MSFKEYDSCRLCPRECGAYRNQGKTGFCNSGADAKIARAALHYWEEPCISGERGSGTVFFSGCTLRCCYCQNYKISHEGMGKEVTAQNLSDIFIKLRNKGAHNINLVTPEHFAPHIREAVLIARERGLDIPIILNSSGYVSEQTLDLLKDSIDIFLVDFKYMDFSLGEKYSLAKDYPAVAKEALKKMHSYAPELIFDSEGILQKGVIVRHLCLPGHSVDSKEVISYLFKTYNNDIRLSIMNQYTPVRKNKDFPVLNNRISDKEYESIIDFCIELGIEDAYIQEGETASESFIPDFENENIII